MGGGSNQFGQSIADILLNDTRHRPLVRWKAEMRTISKRTQYGLKALVALGRRYGSGPMLISSLASEENIPLKFLEGILLDLKGHGLLESKRGKNGGYLLRQSPASITVGCIIRAMEGPLAPLPCASETAFRPCEECPDVESCGTRIVMRQVRDAVAGVLDQTTLADIVRLVEEAKRRHIGEPLMYYI
jgi:Rrf2 family protein